MSMISQSIITPPWLAFAGVVLKEMNESDFKNQEVKNYLVKNFIEHNLLLQEAQRRNIKVDEKKISAVTESFLSEAGTQDLKVYSGSYDTDAKALSEILREKFMVETLISDMINSNIDIKEDEIKNVSNYMFKLLKQNLQKYEINVFQPMPAPIDKIQNKIRWRIIAKGKVSKDVTIILNKCLQNMYSKNIKYTKISIDINPNNMM